MIMITIITTTLFIQHFQKWEFIKCFDICKKFLGNRTMYNYSNSSMLNHYIHTKYLIHNFFHLKAQKWVWSFAPRKQ